MTHYRQLAEIHDEFGVVQVVESGDYRFLEFGAEVEQSCCYVPDPCWLEYDYTRAMLLGALLCESPQRALFLGLGAGTLTMACLRLFPQLLVEAVEIRPAVVQLAREFMGLVEDPRLQIRIGDAREALADCAPADVLFMDLYTDDGPADAHLAWGFLQQCRDRLNPGGWLVINQWSTSNGKPLGAALLRGVFRRSYLECPLTEGNVVLLVPAHDDQVADLAVLAQKAAALEPQLGHSLDVVLQALRPCS